MTSRKISSLKGCGCSYTSSLKDCGCPKSCNCRSKGRCTCNQRNLGSYYPPRARAGLFDPREYGKAFPEPSSNPLIPYVFGQTARENEETWLRPLPQETFATETFNLPSLRGLKSLGSVDQQYILSFDKFFSQTSQGFNSFYDSTSGKYRAKNLSNVETLSDNSSVKSANSVKDNKATFGFIPIVSSYNEIHIYARFGGPEIISYGIGSEVKVSDSEQLSSLGIPNRTLPEIVTSFGDKNIDTMYYIAPERSYIQSLESIITDTAKADTFKKEVTEELGYVYPIRFSVTPNDIKAEFFHEGRYSDNMYSFLMTSILKYMKHCLSNDNPQLCKSFYINAIKKGNNELITSFSKSILNKLYSELTQSLSIKILNVIFRTDYTSYAMDLVSYRVLSIFNKNVGTNISDIKKVIRSIGKNLSQSIESTNFGNFNSLRQMIDFVDLPNDETLESLRNQINELNKNKDSLTQEKNKVEEDLSKIKKDAKKLESDLDIKGDTVRNLTMVTGSVVGAYRAYSYAKDHNANGTQQVLSAIIGGTVGLVPIANLISIAFGNSFIVDTVINITGKNNSKSGES